MGIDGYGGSSPSYTYGNSQKFVIGGASAVVDTTAPTNVNTPPGSATLNGRLEFPSGTSVDYYFEYTMSPTFSTGVQLTTQQSVTASGVNQPVDAPVSGLVAGLYYYHVVAIQDPGTPKSRTLYGRPFTFIIPATAAPSQAPTLSPTATPTPSPTYPAPVVITDPPTNVDSPVNTATLNGHLSYPPATSVTYYYEYVSGPSISGTLTRTSPQTTVTTGSSDVAQPAVLTSLAAGTYSYR